MLAHFVRAVKASGRMVGAAAYHAGASSAAGASRPDVDFAVGDGDSNPCANTKVPCIDAQGLSEEIFAQWDGQEPVILTGLSIGIDNAVAWQGRLRECHGDRVLGYSLRHPNGQRETRRCTLDDFLRCLDAPSPPQRMLGMDELLLDSDQSVRPTSPELLAEDFLEDFFPPEWLPPKFCLVLGTAGARSGLHTDPFGWTGWNALVRGEKVWRFIKPGPDAEHALHVEPPAHVSLAAHNASPVDLYAAVIATNSSSCSSEASCLQTPCASLETLGPDLAQWPRAGDAQVAREVVQKAGEILVFPASWWHQTLHISSTLAVASQYVNRRSARYVLDRLLRTAQLDDAFVSALGVDQWRELAWPEQVRLVCRALEADGWVPKRRGIPTTQAKQPL